MEGLVKKLEVDMMSEGASGGFDIDAALRPDNPIRERNYESLSQLDKYDNPFLVDLGNDGKYLVVSASDFGEFVGGDLGTDIVNSTSDRDFGDGLLVMALDKANAGEVERLQEFVFALSNISHNIGLVSNNEYSLRNVPVDIRGDEDRVESARHAEEDLRPMVEFSSVGDESEPPYFLRWVQYEAGSSQNMVGSDALNLLNALRDGELNKSYVSVLEEMRPGMPKTDVAAEVDKCMQVLREELTKELSEVNKETEASLTMLGEFWRERVILSEVEGDDLLEIDPGNDQQMDRLQKVFDDFVEKQANSYGYGDFIEEIKGIGSNWLERMVREQRRIEIEAAAKLAE